MPASDSTDPAAVQSGNQPASGAVIRPDVSVIIPAHRDDAWLEAAVMSVLEQQGAEFEVIVVSNGVAEAPTAPWVKNARVRVIHTAEKLGPTRAMIRGIEASEAPFIARLDADDLMLPGRLASQLGYLATHPDTPLVGTAVERISSEGEPLGTFPFPTGPDVRKALTFENVVPHSSVLMRRSALDVVGGYDARLDQMEDYDLILRLGASGPIAVLPEVGTQYRLHETQTSQSAGHSGLPIDKVIAGRTALAHAIGMSRFAIGARNTIWRAVQVARVAGLTPGVRRGVQRVGTVGREASDELHIAFVVNNYPPRTGGLEKHVSSLARALVERGVRVTVVCLGVTPGWREDDGVRVLTLPEHVRIADVLGFPGFGTRRKLTKLLQDIGANVVSVHTRFFSMTWVGGRAAKRAGLPLVHTEHGSGFVAGGSLLIRVASRVVDLTLGRGALRRADQVLGVSQEVVDFVEKLAGVRAHVFHNAIDAVPRPLPAHDDRPEHLVFVGRMVSGKGWDVVLDVVAGLRASKHAPRVQATLLGDGPEFAAMRAQIASRGLESVVHAPGRVSADVVRDTLRGSTLVNPTVLSEGFQTTLLEAIAEEGRVVTYPVAGAHDLRAQGAPVVVTEARDPEELQNAVADVIANPPPLAAPGLIDQWTWTSRVEQFIEVCADMR